MQVKTVDLYKTYGLKREEGQEGTLVCYIHGTSPEISETRRRPAMLVVAGGGYWNVSDREREPISIEYFAQGYNVFELKYSVNPFSYPVQQTEACMAMAYIRDNAEELKIRPDKVAAVGFSAGGHLVGTLSTLCDAPEMKKIFGDRNLRPDASVFSYAVITGGILTHAGTMDNVSGGDATLRKKLSIENCVNEKCSPAFIWCTGTDEAVPCEDSLMLAAAYRKAGVPFELHIFEDGVHGLSVCSEESRSKWSDKYINEPVSKWLPLSFTWLKNHGFLLKD